MVIYENAALWSKKRGFFDKGTYDLDLPEQIEQFKQIAHIQNETIYLIREFIVVDSEYQDQAPSRCARDWYVLKVEPDEYIPL